MSDVIRVNKNKDFSVMSNKFLRADYMSFRAKGVLAHILTHSDEYNITIGGIVASSKDGRTSVSGAIKELIECGHCTRENNREESTGRITGTKYTFYEDRKKVDLSNSEPQAGNPITDNPTMVNPITDNHQQRSTNLKKYQLEEESIKRLSVEQAQPEDIPEVKISPSDTDKFNQYIELCNRELSIDGGITHREFKGSAKVRSQFLARLQDGYKGGDFVNAMKNAMADKYHKETNFRYLTPEFFSREDKLDLWLNVARKKTVDEIRKERNIPIV